MPKKPGDKRPITITLEEAVIEKIEKIAESLHKNRPSIIKEAIDKYLNQMERTNPQIFQTYEFKSIHD